MSWSKLYLVISAQMGMEFSPTCDILSWIKQMRTFEFFLFLHKHAFVVLDLLLDITKELLQVSGLFRQSIEDHIIVEDVTIEFGVGVDIAYGKLHHRYHRSLALSFCVFFWCACSFIDILINRWMPHSTNVSRCCSNRGRICVRAYVSYTWNWVKTLIFFSSAKFY